MLKEENGMRDADLDIQETKDSEDELVTKKSLVEWKNTTKKKIDEYTDENNLLNKENESLRNQLIESRHRESLLNSSINDAHITLSMSVPHTNRFSYGPDTNRTLKINESVEDNLNHQGSINHNISTHTDLILVTDKGPNTSRSTVKNIPMV